jgi:hypothetical protein
MTADQRLARFEAIRRAADTFIGVAGLRMCASRHRGGYRGSGPNPGMGPRRLTGPDPRTGLKPGATLQALAPL